MDSHYVVNPYFTEEESKRKARLDAWHTWEEEAIVGGFALALLPLMLYYFLHPELPSAFILLPFICGLAGGIAAYRAMGAVDEKRAELGERQMIKSSNAAAQAELELMSEALETLPPDLRADLRPLWDKALEANRIMADHGDDEALLAIIRERTQAADKVAKEHEALEAEVRSSLSKQAASDARLTTDEDLLIARIHAESLAAGRTKFLELGPPELR